MNPLHNQNPLDYDAFRRAYHKENYLNSLELEYLKKFKIGPSHDFANKVYEDLAQMKRDVNLLINSKAIQILFDVSGTKEHELPASIDADPIEKEYKVLFQKYLRIMNSEYELNMMIEYLHKQSHYFCEKISFLQNYIVLSRMQEMIELAESNRIKKEKE